MMYNTKDYLSIQPRQSCVASFQIFYGIGKVKAIKLNSFLLNHPTQGRFTFHFGSIIHPSTDTTLWRYIPRDSRIRLSVQHHLRKKSLTFCYQTYRLFQNLPTRGQRTRANAKSIINHHPYKALSINISFYQSLEVAYKKRELLYNGRHDELNTYTEAQNQTDKMKKEDEKAKRNKAKQRFMKNQKNKK